MRWSLHAIIQYKCISGKWKCLLLFLPQGARRVEKFFCCQSSVQTYAKGSKHFAFALIHLLASFQNTQIVLELLATEVYGKNICMWGRQNLHFIKAVWLLPCKLLSKIVLCYCYKVLKFHLQDNGCSEEQDLA